MQNRDRKKDAEIVREYRQRVKAARERKSSIPGPKEAKECMLELEKKHLISRRVRLQVFPPPAPLWHLRDFFNLIFTSYVKQ